MGEVVEGGVVVAASFVDAAVDLEGADCCCSGLTDGVGSSAMAEGLADSSADKSSILMLDVMFESTTQEIVRFSPS